MRPPDIARVSGIVLSVLLVAPLLMPSVASASPDDSPDDEAPVLDAPKMGGLPDLGALGDHIRALLAAPDLTPVVGAWAEAPVWSGVEPPTVTASAVAVLDEASMSLLAARDEHERRAPASLTKIVTAILAVESGQLDEIVRNDVESWAMPGSSLMGLHPGDEFTLRDLTYGLMLRSGNDAALSIGRHLADYDGIFVYWMNSLADQLELSDTHFIDPHGLGGHGHYSSAYDLALLARYAMQSPEFATIASASTWTTTGTNEIAMTNYVIPFLDGYPGGEGMKTGYTVEAGPTFVASAVRDGHRIYVVLLNTSDRFGEATALLDWAFENHAWPGAPTTFKGMAAQTDAAD